MTNVIPHPTLGSGRSPFDAIRRMDERGEHWTGREMQPLMQYSQWRDFATVIQKAKDSLALVQGETAAQDHFAEVRNMIPTGKGAHRATQDYRLTRFGAYLTAMAGDDTKEAVAHARVYFAVKTREAETRPTIVPQEYTRKQLILMALEAEEAREAAEELARQKDVQRAFAEAKNKALTAKTNELTEEIRVIEPKARGYEQLMEADGTVSMAQAAKMLNIGLGRNSFYDLLREMEIIQKSSTEPYQRYIDRGYFKLRAGTRQSSRDTLVMVYTTRVTAKGLDFLRKVLGM